MRMRYRTVLYQLNEGESLRHHYQDLVDDVVHQIQSSLAVSRRMATWRPSSDIHEGTDAYIVKMELAGMAEEEIEVTLYNDAVVVSGTRRDEDIYGTETSFHEAQIRYGPFQATIVLPTPIDREHAEAHYHNGFLHLKLPKRPPERIQVKPGRAIEGQSSEIAAPPAGTMPEDSAAPLLHHDIGDAQHDR